MSYRDTLTATTMNNLAILLKQCAYNNYISVHSMPNKSANHKNTPVPPKPAASLSDPDVFDPTLMNNTPPSNSFTESINSSDSIPIVVIPKCSMIRESTSLYKKAIEIRQDTLGDSHPDTVTAMYNYMELLICTGVQRHICIS